MSIIEQALHKLEDLNGQADRSRASEEIMFPVHYRKQPFSSSMKLFLLAILLLSIIALYIVIQIKSFNTVDNPNIEPEIKTIEQASKIDKLNTGIIQEIISQPTIVYEPVINSVPNWISTGWNWLDSVSMNDALQFWESGFQELESDTVLYITDIIENSVDAEKVMSKQINHDSAFYLRWPLAMGNRIVGLCIPSENYDDLSRHNCNSNLSKTEAIVKSDLSMALYLRKIEDVNQQERLIPKKTIKIVEKPEQTPVSVKRKPRQLHLEMTIPEQLAMGNYEHVLDLLKRNRHQLANAWEYYYWQSQAYAALGDISKARKSVDIGIKKNQQQALLWVQKGLLMQEAGAHREAINIFKKAELLNGKPASLYLNLGYSAAVLGEISLAIRAYRQYLFITESDSNQNIATRQQIEDYLAQVE